MSIGTSGIAINPARPGDGAALRAMAHALAESHNAGQHFVATAEDFETALFQPHPVVGALVARIGGVPAGCAVWHRSFSTFRGREVMYLEDLSVLPQFRRRGVARALLCEVARVAVATPYAAIYWLMMDWNAEGRALYESVGAAFEPGVNVCRLDGVALERLAR